MLSHKTSLFVGHLVGILYAFVKIVHFPVDPGPGKLGREYAAFSEFAGRSDDQFAFKNGNGQMFAGVQKRPGTSDRHGFAFGLFVTFCEQARSFIGDRGF